MFMRGLLIGTPISLLLWYGVYRAWIAMFWVGSPLSEGNFYSTFKT
jgi:hypothetical protein